jgi:hypothetical protein
MSYGHCVSVLVIIHVAKRSLPFDIALCKVAKIRGGSIGQTTASAPITASRSTSSKMTRSRPPATLVAVVLSCIIGGSSAFSTGSWGHSKSLVGVQNDGRRFGGSMQQRRQISAVSLGSGRSSSNISASNGMSMVIDRLSKECIGAIMVAQSESKVAGLDSLSNAMITLGVVTRPERANRTLEKFNILPKKVKVSATKVATGTSPKAADDEGMATAASTDMDGADALPFSEEAKATLSRAGTIADRFASKTVRSEHLLLALLEYNVDAGSAATKGVGGADSSCKALSVILNADGVDADVFDAFAFCDSLLDDLLEQGPVQEEVGVDANGENNVEAVTQKEVVVIGGSSGNTPTLDDVGIDLTLMALEGKLDAVYGRDDEVRMCLRTLGRRRKNNPCLIGVSTK